MSEEKKDAEPKVATAGAPKLVIPKVSTVQNITDRGDVLRFEGSGHLINSRGQRLHTQAWLQPGGKHPKALVFCVHGYGYYIADSYKVDVGPRLRSMGFDVYGHDQIGHGHSEGERCYVPKFQDLVDDLLLFVKEVKATYEKEVPVFLHGESMGGAVSILAAMDHPHMFAGVILSSPMCKIDDEMMPPPCTIRCLKCLACCCPKAKLIDPPSEEESVLDRAIRDKQYVINAKRDVLRYAEKKVRLGTGLSLLNATLRITKEKSKFTAPVALFHGLGDRVTKPEASKDFFDGISSTDKSLYNYEDLWHVFLLEEAKYREVVWKDQLDWIHARLSGPVKCSKHTLRTLAEMESESMDEAPVEVTVPATLVEPEPRYTGATKAEMET